VDGLDGGYTGRDGSTQVSREAVSKLVADASKNKRRAQEQKPPKPAAEEKTLCEKRKTTNNLLCGIFGSVAAGRSAPNVSLGTNAALSATIAAGCESAANWLEENAPGGACGK
jgi:hypothetical protein